MVALTIMTRTPTAARLPERDASDGLASLVETAVDSQRRRGRGAQSNASGRFEAEARVAFDDGWQSMEDLPPFKTVVGADTARRVITRNESPDIGFDRSINPYRGCEHGCVYCFARPTHAYLGLSPGLDFETRNCSPSTTRRSCSKRNWPQDGYQPRMIAIGTNTDPYQPIERDLKIMRGILEVLERTGASGGHRHQVGAGGARHRPSGADGEAQSGQGRRSRSPLWMAKLARTMEPRASTPTKRLEALKQLSDAGISTKVMVAPLIPALNDAELERILDSAAYLGVKEASYILLRLPLEVRDLFREWLASRIIRTATGTSSR